MAILSVYAQNKLVDWINGKANMPAHATTYLALFNGNPASGGTETTLTICSARIAISSAMGSSTGGAASSTNASDLTFTTSALADSVISYLAAYDSLTSGNLLWYLAVSSNNVYAGNQVRLLATTLVVSVGGDLTSYSKDYLVNWLTGKSDFPATTNRYYSLWSSNPQGGSPVEVTATVRTAGRVMFSNDMPAASAGTSTNNILIDFGDAAAPATIGWTGCSNALTGGNLICSHAVTGSAQNVVFGNPVRVPIGGQTVNAT